MKENTENLKQNFTQKSSEVALTFASYHTKKRDKLEQKIQELFQTINNLEIENEKLCKYIHKQNQIVVDLAEEVQVLQELQKFYNIDQESLT